MTVAVIKKVNKKSVTTYKGKVLQNGIGRIIIITLAGKMKSFSKKNVQIEYMEE